MVSEPMKAGRRYRSDDMDEDEGCRVSADEGASSIYSVSDSGRSGKSGHDRDRQGPPSEWDRDTDSNAISAPPSARGISLSVVHELIESAHAVKAGKGDWDVDSHKQFNNSSKTLINRGDNGGLDDEACMKQLQSQSQSNQPSNTSDIDRSTILADLLLASAPQLRHLAKSSSINTASSVRRSPSVTPTAEQRHPGKPGVRLSNFHRPFEPDINEKQEDDWGLNTPTMAAKNAPADEVFVTGLPLILLIIGLSLVVFLISIDRTIITTAIPFITEEFKSTSDIGWYGSSYLLTACAFQPVFGRVFTLFNVKWSYLFSMFIFELGSIISGFSPNSPALIIGRSIAGLGSAGILTGSFVIVATAVPLDVRPIYTAVVGLMFGVGATIGPLIGGVFTDLATWRWCFWLNLPVGAVTIIVMFFVLHPAPHKGPKRSFVDRLIDLDLIGNVILLVAAVMLFLALEFTLTGAAWGSAKIIGLLVGTILTVIVLNVWLWWKQDGALIPPAIIKQRTVAASCGMAFFTYGALLIQTYFLPIWFQAILGYSAIQSGVAMIPYFVANALFSLFSGIFVSAAGYFAPPAILGSAIGTVGCGIITLFHPGISTGMWIGFEILASAGFGLSIQQGFTAVQTVLKQDDLAVGTAAVVASQSLGGALFISVGNSVFQNRLEALVMGASSELDGLDVRSIIDAGATAFRKLVSEEQLPLLIDLYNRALHDVLVVAIPLGGLAFVSCCFLEWKSVKPPPKTDADANTGETGIQEAS